MTEIKRRAEHVDDVEQPTPESQDPVPQKRDDSWLYHIEDSDTEMLLISSSLGLDVSSISLRRYLPVEIYFAGADREELTQIVGAIQFWMVDLGFSPCRAWQEQVGSIRLREILRTEEPLTAEELRIVQLRMKVAIEDAFTSLDPTILHSKGHKHNNDLEEEKIRSEILKNKADAFKAISDGATAVGKAILATAVGVSILIGTVRITKIEVPGFGGPKVTVESVPAKRTVEEWSAPKSVAADQHAK